MKQAMCFHRALAPAAFVATLLLASSPALADRRGDEHHRTDGRAAHESRAESRPAQPRAVAPPHIVAPSVAAPPRSVWAPRAEAVAPRYPAAQARAPQSYYSRGYGHAVPRSSYPARVYSAPWVIRSVPYYRPYYAFRPRFGIGFGLFVGFPVAYPYFYGPPAYVYPAYPYPAYPPSQAAYGGISFDISPDDAGIFVDGQYVGIVRDFSPTYQPLTLTPGMHHVELQAMGSVPMVFDLQVMAGQVVPYRGTLQLQ